MIETPRLLIRELTEEDAEALYAIYQDPMVMRFMGPPPASLEEERGNIEAHRRRYYESRGYGLWALIARESGVLIGRCGLLDVTVDDAPEVELSYLLATAYWRRGLAAEAARATLDFASASLGLERIVAFVHPLNERSARVAERIGMRRERVVRYKSFGDVDLFAWTQRAHSRS